MELTVEELQKEVYKQYSEWMSKISAEDKVNIIRFIADTMESLTMYSMSVDPFELINYFKRGRTSWYNEIKALIKRFPQTVANDKMSYGHITTELKLDMMEEPSTLTITSMVIIQNKNALVGGKIYMDSTGCLILSMIPQNDIRLSSFVLAHEIAHHIIDVVGIEKTDYESQVQHIAYEMLADYFAAFAYNRVNHFSLTETVDNLVKMMRTIVCSDERMEEIENRIRHANLYLIGEKIQDLVYITHDEE